MSSRRNLLLACGVMGALASPLQSQEARTVAAARVAAIPLLQQNGEIHDTSRVAADLEDLYKRFVTCDSTENRRGCLINGSGAVKMVSIRLVHADTAQIEVLSYVNLTRRCPGGPPINPPIITHIQIMTYRLVYADGRWGKLLRLGGAAC